LIPGFLQARQIGRMVDDAHSVGLCEAGTQPVREVIVGRVPGGLQGLTLHDPTRYSPVGTTSPSSASALPIPSAKFPGVAARPPDAEALALGERLEAIRLTSSRLL